MKQVFQTRKNGCRGKKQAVAVPSFHINLLFLQPKTAIPDGLIHARHGADRHLWPCRMWPHQRLHSMWSCRRAVIYQSHFMDDYHAENTNSVG